MTDLLDLLAQVEASDDEPHVLHMVMPNMAPACGADLFRLYDAARSDGIKRTTLTTARTTCPDCLAVGDLRALTVEMQRRQADVTN